MVPFYNLEGIKNKNNLGEWQNRHMVACSYNPSPREAKAEQCQSELHETLCFKIWQHDKKSMSKIFKVYPYDVNLYQ